MKHNISITTIEALLINKALGMDMMNEIDNSMAELLKSKINDVVEYDLKDHRCEDCKFFLREVEKMARNDVIDEFVEWLGKHHNYGKCVIDMYVEEYKEQLKEKSE